MRRMETSLKKLICLKPKMHVQSKRKRDTHKKAKGIPKQKVEKIR